jgi:hypothetical protein
MTGAEIIEKFQLQTDDATELSSDEELDLLNDVYLETCSDRAWNLLKTTVSGTVVNNIITLPDDFGFLYPNQNYQGNGTEGTLPAILIGSTYQPYRIVNFDDRRKYVNAVGFAYLDLANNRIVFTGTPTDTAYEFDYIKVPALLTTATEPIFPDRFHKYFAYRMAIEDSIIQMSDRVEKLAQLNGAGAKRYMDNMEYWDSKQDII